MKKIYNKVITSEDMCKHDLAPAILAIEYDIYLLGEFLKNRSEGHARYIAEHMYFVNTCVTTQRNAYMFSLNCPEINIRKLEKEIVDRLFIIAGKDHA